MSKVLGNTLSKCHIKVITMYIFSSMDEVNQIIIMSEKQGCSTQEAFWNSQLRGQSTKTMKKETTTR